MKTPDNDLDGLSTLDHSARQEVHGAPTPLLPVRIEKGGIHYAQGMRAGKWLFATGHLATDYKSGLDPSLINPSLPHTGRPKNEREGEVIFEHLKALLKHARADISAIVRLDQFYTSWRAVDPYHVARRIALGKHIPPSTSVVQSGLLLPGAEIEVEMVALSSNANASVQSVADSPISAPTTSGFMPVAVVGDYVFVAGQMATAEDGVKDIAPEACLPRGSLWQGTKIKLETEYILKRRVIPCLKAAGASLSSVVKAQVYLRDLNDIAAFNRVWSGYFSDKPPATTIVSAADFGHVDGRIEINFLALVENGTTQKSVVSTSVFSGYETIPAAVYAGDMLFFSGLMAIDRDGAVRAAQRDPRQPYFGQSIQDQMRLILSNAQEVCKQAGTSLENVVRIQQFHTDLHDFYPAYQVWREFVGDAPLPFSAIAVPAIPVPGCSVLLDLWVYRP